MHHPSAGQTLSELILSHAAGQQVHAGDLVIVPVDRCMTHDSLTPEIIDALEKNLGVNRIYDPERVAVVMDHVAPAASVQTANAQVRTRRWVAQQGIRHFYDVGAGVCHQVLIEERLVLPGQVAIGSDSHATSYGAIGAFGTGMGTGDLALILASGRTWLRVPETIRVQVVGRFRKNVSPKDISLYLCGMLGLDGATYQAVEFHGVDWLSLDGREVLAGMSTEIGAKVGIVPPSGEIASRYNVPEWLRVQPGAHYVRTIEVDLNTLGSQVAVPPEVDHIAPASELGDVKVDQVFVGTCTNGRLEDLHILAELLKGHKLAAGVRLLVIPASHRILQAAAEDGTLSILLAAGATLGTPGCGPCIGRHMGVIGADEVCLSTANRNFRGRMGDPNARIYLASPEVAAATALRGSISDPANL
ncbi:MAG: 3-isopropylmalate dehydratase large subunit [Chloroflexi bacterium]|nr:3-isopropylmalate dehydratase large subunit [Chloroflexota bacterium]